MLTRFCQTFLSTLIISSLPTEFLLAQTGENEGYLTLGLLIIAAIIFLTAVYLVTENLFGIQAKEEGIDDLPSSSSDSMLSKWFQPKVPDYVQGRLVRLKKGHDIKLKGAPAAVIEDATVNTYAVQPGNFVGMSPIPKVVVEVGDEVRAGDELFFDKKRPEIRYVAPVSGEIAAINRGQKRAISEVVILADKEQKHKSLDRIDLDAISREDLVNFLVANGAWPLLRQRPYDIVPAIDSTPEHIFISTFQSGPMGADQNLVVTGAEKVFATGLKLLSLLTEGEVHLGLNARGDGPPARAFREAEGVRKTWYHGPHPAGNVGVQIHHTRPIGAHGEVWTLGVQEVITLGRMITEQRFDASRIVALTGQSFDRPRYVRTHLGANLKDLVEGEGLDDNDRVISGDVLSGEAKSRESFLNFYDDQVTAIPEGREFELFGWLLPLKMRPSLSRTFPGFLFKDAQYEVTTNTHGEERAFVMTGQYENVLPMDIYPQHLMKAILNKDFERMEGLGIYELSEEDVALCEFACTSKQPLQHILRAGLDLMREQG